MKTMTPRTMNKVLNYVAEKEADMRKGTYCKQVLFHCISYQLRNDLQRQILMLWADKSDLQERCENPFDYLSRVERTNWDEADEDKRKRIFRRHEGWCLTIKEKYEFFRQFMDAKKDR